MAKKHQCNLYQQFFYNRRHLKKHMLIHDEEKQHMCDECSMTFSKAYTMKYHMLVDHNIAHTCR